MQATSPKGGKTSSQSNKLGRIRDRNTQRILDAAEHEFVRLGFKGATIQAIANRAGLPKANIHYYFRSKSELYTSVLNRIVALWNTQFGAISADDDPAVALDNFIREKVRLSYQHRRASKLFAMEIISGAPLLEDYLRSDMRKWVRSRAKVMQQWIDSGRMKPCDPTLLIFLIWSSTQHYADFDAQVLNIMNRRDYQDDMIEDIADFLSETILRGCGLQPPRRERK